MLLALGYATDAAAQSLTPSRASLDLQNRQARAHEFTYLRNSHQVERFVREGFLVQVPRRGRHHVLHNVSFPFARPEVEEFILRLAADFHAACGEPLVVTSLTRPQSHQPPNASSRSVHPTGMAVDLRRAYDRAFCRDWLDRELLALEAAGVLEAAVERYPPHYHLALFPRPYRTFTARLAARTGHGELTVPTAVTHVVRRADTLWDLARAYGSTPADIRLLNGLSSNVIHPGQELAIPAATTR